MGPVWNFINKPFAAYDVGGINIEPTYWQAAAIVFLIFLLVFTLARVRRLYVGWNLGKSALAMFCWGFLTALIVEGFFIIGGRTLFTEILGWENAPKPVSTALDMGREKLVDVLGIKDEIPQSAAKSEPTYQTVVSDYINLSEDEAETARSLICEP